MRGWIDETRRIDLRQVANEVGLQAFGSTHLGPCPACGEVLRSKNDTRKGPLYLLRQGQSWRCSWCDQGGSSLDLVGHTLRVGPVSPEARAWWAARGWCTAAPEAPPVPRVQPRPPPAPPKDERPPAAEVAELWARCTLVGDDAEVATWLRARGLEVGVVEDLDLARALPVDRLPRWAAGWTRFGARCVVPTFDADGQVAALRGRVVTLPRPPGPKVLAAKGSPVGVLADGTARALLRGDPWVLTLERKHLFVTEGEVDHLIRSSDAGDSPVLGVAGAKVWPKWLADRIPSGWTVQVDAHVDEAGDALVARIVAELGRRCRITRTRIRRAA